MPEAFSIKLSKVEIVRRADAQISGLQERNERQHAAITRLSEQHATAVEICRHYARRKDNAVDPEVRAKAQLANEIIKALGAQE